MNISPQFGRIYKLSSMLAHDHRSEETKLALGHSKDTASDWALSDAKLQAHQELTEAIAVANHLNTSDVISYRLYSGGDTFVVVSASEGKDADRQSKAIVTLLEGVTTDERSPQIPGYRFIKKGPAPSLAKEKLNEAVENKQFKQVLASYEIANSETTAQPKATLTHNLLLLLGTEMPTNLRELSLLVELFPNVKEFFKKESITTGA